MNPDFVVQTKTSLAGKWRTIQVIEGDDFAEDTEMIELARLIVDDSKHGPLAKLFIPHPETWLYRIVKRTNELIERL